MRAIYKKLLSLPMDSPEDIVSNAKTVLGEIKNLENLNSKIRAEKIAKDDPNVRKLMGFFL